MSVFDSFRKESCQRGCCMYVVLHRSSFFLRFFFLFFFLSSSIVALRRSIDKQYESCEIPALYCFMLGSLSGSTDFDGPSSDVPVCVCEGEILMILVHERSRICTILHQFGLRGALTVLLGNHLLDRAFRVRASNHYSSIHGQENDIPLGSLLSVTLCIQ